MITQNFLQSVLIPAFQTRPPNGCLQYQEGLTGTIQTFNFQDSTNNQHLAEQSYAHCIRREAGYCCIQYQLCAADNSFKLNNKAGDEKALIDTSCTLDYIGIESKWPLFLIGQLE